jgi:hypothetical protein
MGIDSARPQTLVIRWQARILRIPPAFAMGRGVLEIHQDSDSQPCAPILEIAKAGRPASLRLRDVVGYGLDPNRVIFSEG